VTTVEPPPRGTAINRWLYVAIALLGGAAALALWDVTSGYSLGLVPLLIGIAGALMDYLRVRRARRALAIAAGLTVATYLGALAITFVVVALFGI
jgi:hypothetical protein